MSCRCFLDKVMEKVFVKQNRSILIAGSLLVMGFAGGLHAETRHHDQHVHGVGKLNVALDGNNLLIELNSPAANLVGFEHAPKTEEQTHALHDAAKLLEQGEKLFHLTQKAECTLHEAHVENDLAGTNHDEHQADTPHEHDDRHHDGHDDKHGEHDKEHGGVHSDFEATYHFVCAQPERLQAIKVQLFTHFKGFEELEVQLLTPKMQTGVELTPKKPQISL